MKPCSFWRCNMKDKRQCTKSTQQKFQQVIRIYTFFIMRVIKDWNRLHRDCASSILGDSKNLIPDSPGKPGLTLMLDLFWSGSLIIHLPPPLKLFCDSMKIDIWISSKMERWFWAKLFSCFHCCAYNRTDKVEVTVYICHVNFQDHGLVSKLKGKIYSATSESLAIALQSICWLFVLCRCRSVCLSQRS